ncbi:hypothetical protein BU24DRAFT_429713 [Aaosphaeria arxii CBS 175.79]|uniref:Uncharacterized protein n=1 Tax=Aaosphaeria arxii CBS 175.79 TaxID=1450172 RepID=A0A6A5Y5W1_9PLEO|nr:uncharacterized protein BU24DRAFT_429713 [Aaosphaeria arxii CBS 175.79]KAF2020679.1 hypothetical protein BU24DRAFT_429713 [Aaosphaeria arxii CBS 175.79]
MVLSVLVAIISAPALLGTQEAIRQSQAKEKREEHRARRCNLIATCVKSSLRSREINGRPLVLRNGKIYIDTGTSDGSPFGHAYAGYYLPYPDTKYEGLVTTITDEAPIMNWVYVDRETCELKYGVRANAQPNLTGPFDCTRQDRRLTFDGWEGFCAVEEFPTLWAVYFDLDDDGLRGKVPEGTRVLDIELSRKEKRWKKESESRQQDQTTKREVDTKTDAPHDKPITVTPQLNPPGAGAEVNVEPPAPFPLPKTIFPDSAPLPMPVPDSEDAAQARPVARTPSPGATKQQSPPSAERKSRSSSTTTTPKLNRSSGSRALAQAQKFEAMSQAEPPPLLRTAKSFNRRESSNNSDSASNYSESGTTDIIGAYARPYSAVVPAAAATLDKPIKASDPAIFGASTGKSPPRASVAKEVSSSTRDKKAVVADETMRKRPTPSVQTSRPRKESLPPVPNPTSRSSSRNTSSPVDRRTASMDRTRPLERRPTVSREALARSSPRPVRDTSSSRRVPPASSSPSPSASLTRERGASTSSTRSNDARSLPKPLSRTNTTPVPGKRSMAGMTMTSGSMTSMSRQMAPPIVPGRDRTNSSLYREIDDILKPGSIGDGGSRSSQREERKDSRGNERDRPQPLLRRAQTSKALPPTTRGRGSVGERDGRSRRSVEKKPPGVF